MIRDFFETINLNKTRGLTSSGDYRNVIFQKLFKHGRCNSFRVGNGWWRREPRVARNELPWAD